MKTENWRKRLIRAMKGKRCLRSKKEERERDDSESNQNRDRDDAGRLLSDACNKADANFSPKKRRHATPNTPYIPTNITSSPSTLRFGYNTPPPGTLTRYSPPQLEHRIPVRSPINISSERSNLFLPSLLPPSNRIENSDSASSSSFKLNPRLNWNVHNVSRQLRQSRGSETTMSSLLNDEILPSHHAIPFAQRSTRDSNEDRECTMESITRVIKPVPVRGSGTVASTINLECDNVTLKNIMEEMSCCSWFNPSWTSAFDVVVPKNKKKDKKEQE